MSKWKFNDYTLPGLPAEWNQITYPYAVIVCGKYLDENPANAFTFRLVCSGEPYTALKVDGVDVIGIKPYTIVHHFRYYRSSEEWVWEDMGSIEVGGEDWEIEGEGELLWCYFSPSKTEYIWCNEDIKNSSNQVIFEGSDPILVEDDPEPEVTDTRDLRTYCLGIALELMKKALPISNPSKDMSKGGE